LINGDLGIELVAILLFDVIEHLIHLSSRMAFGDVREHQHETAIRIVGETLIARGFGQGKDGVIIQAKVQDGVHHARHRLTSAGTNGDQKRHAIFGAEGLAIDFFDFVKMFNDVFPDKIRNLLAGIVVESASFGRDGETSRNVDAGGSHLAETCALASKNVLAEMSGMGFFEGVDVLLFCHIVLLMTIVGAFRKCPDTKTISRSASS
jgi:hypothetical protein